MGYFLILLGIMVLPTTTWAARCADTEAGRCPSGTRLNSDQCCTIRTSQYGGVRSRCFVARPFCGNVGNAGVGQCAQGCDPATTYKTKTKPYTCLPRISPGGNCSEFAQTEINPCTEGYACDYCSGIPWPHGYPRALYTCLSVKHRGLCA